jgi:hypothetical protein
MPSSPIFVSRCRWLASYDFSSATACGFHRRPVAAIPASRAVDCRQQARVRATTTRVDTNFLLL